MDVVSRYRYDNQNTGMKVYVSSDIDAHNMVFAVELLQLLCDFECAIRACIVHHDYFIRQIAVR